MKVAKIVITGGPCAGKTTGMTWIQNAFTQRGYTVIFIAETATELISSGVTPWTCRSNLDFQKHQMKLQLEKEDVYWNAAHSLNSEKVLIVCDRGAYDNRAYMNDEEFAEVLKYVGRNPVELRDSYHAVFHLMTAAKGAAEFYTNANNTARRETKEEAIALDERLVEVWTGHPHLRIIDNATDFEGKMKKLVSEIAAYLGEPEFYSMNRKFLIDYPDVKQLEKLPNCQKIEIKETFLMAREGEMVRICQRGADGHFLYYETIRHIEKGNEFTIMEQRVSKEEYMNKLMHADMHALPIQRTRYYLSENGNYYQIDTFPFWKNQALLKIPSSKSSGDVELPKLIQSVQKEVTGDGNFRTRQLAFDEYMKSRSQYMKNL